MGHSKFDAIKSNLDISDYDFLQHYGIKRRSGRYPWGSGDNPHQHDDSFLGRVAEARSRGLNNTEIAKEMGMSVQDFRDRITIENHKTRMSDMNEAYRLKEAGYSTAEIARRMNRNESSIRSLLDPSKMVREQQLDTAKSALSRAIEKNKYIDIGPGVEQQLDISRTKLKTAVKMLKDEGYTVHYIKQTQYGTGNETTITVLAAPGTPWKEVWDHKAGIRSMVDGYSNDGGLTFQQIRPPVSISSDRVSVVYAEQGGTERDGLIELRRGVPDLNMGNSRYAQVRIAVDGTHYLKGMAMYSDDLPKGIDIRFNTNKHEGTPMIGPDKDHTVLKPIKDDPDAPFGATISRQIDYFDSKGEKHQSPINIVNEEGKWATWSKTLSSQMLSKQSPELAKRQLAKAYQEKEEEFKEILSYTNPAVRKYLLKPFSEDCDASASDLKAAALPRTAGHVLLPFPSISPKEIYAPNYENGEEVVLIRHPHGGIFEIPRLIVNNKNPEAKAAIPNAKDAVGINAKVAEQLSGADFDGDTVLVIPTKGTKIKTAGYLEGLKNFDPKEAYPGYSGMPRMTDRDKGMEMGKASNLITDMTIKGANLDEICDAVKYSMVVIDAQKHNLNYKQAYTDFNIPQLKEKYQGGKNRGASTLISRSTSEYDVKQRKMITSLNPKTVDPKTGKLIFQETGATYIGKDGKEHPRMTKVTKMSVTDDAFSLSSGTEIERVYAEHANRLKALANEARKAAIFTPSQKYNTSANKAYSEEVASLLKSLKTAQANAPLERRATILSNEIMKAKLADNPELKNDKDALRKEKGRALQVARNRVGAHKTRIPISPKEWEAIQAGAISNNRLMQILSNTDMDIIKEYSMPRQQRGMTSSQISRAKNMLARGYTQAEVAKALGVSASTISGISLEDSN